MQHKLPPLPVRIAIGVLVLGTLAFFGIRSLNGETGGEITASGTIEGTIVNIAPEMAGKVADVLAGEGDSVSKDSPLLRLDPGLLNAQQAVAAAQVDSAKAALDAAQLKYDQTLQSALAQQEAARAKDFRFSAPDEFNQPAWYFNQQEQIQAAQTEVDNAKAAVDEALANLEKVTNDLNNADFVAAEARLSKARTAFEVADQVKVQAENAAEAGGLRDAAYDYYNAALAELNAAQSAYNALLNTRAANDVKYARGRVIIAQQRYDTAYNHLLSLQTGAESPAVLSAAKAVDQAKAALAQAEANLALLETQISKLTVNAPIEGVILTRNVEPGEFIQPGGAALTMADLAHLTITVYVPENLYGNISLGQKASVSVDSFPAEIFEAVVIQIADQAEFTPRNVQTVEGRSSTFYAIKLQVNDPDGKLKIGMPADVIFK